MAEPLTPEALSALIGSIYDCTLEPSRWEQTLTQIRDEFPLRKCGAAFERCSPRSHVIGGGSRQCRPMNPGKSAASFSLASFIALRIAES